MNLIPEQQTRLTLDTDSGRFNSFPCIVKDTSGRLISFYEKTLSSGRISNSRVTYTAPFSVSVEAGNGIVNDTPVSWLVSNLVVAANSYTLIYVGLDGIVRQTTSYDMSVVKDVVLLAFVNSGASAITRVENLEKTGRYIFLRKQTWNGTTWVWGNIETRLNTGEQPSINYDETTNKVYLSYHRDDVSYVRVYDLSDELTFDYVPHISVDSGTIYLDNNPELTTSIKASCSKQKVIGAELFPFDTPNLGFKNPALYPVVSVPSVTGPLTGYISGPVIMTVYRLVGETYVSEGVISFNNNNIYAAPGRWRQWSGTEGLKFCEIRVPQNAYVGDYKTDIIYYRQIEIRFTQDKTTTIGTTINNETMEIVTEITGSGGPQKIIKGQEFSQSFNFYDESVDIVGNSNKSQALKAQEFSQSFNFFDESVDILGNSSKQKVTKAVEIPV